MPEWKQKRVVFVHVSLNANELLLPALFSRIGLCLHSLYLRYSANFFLIIIMSIALKSCILTLEPPGVAVYLKPPAGKFYPRTLKLFLYG